MKTYLMLFCRYDPDNFTGYQQTKIKAETIEKARESARAFIRKNYFHVRPPYEYRLFEIVFDDSPRLYDPHAEEL
jgi:hypothetical protein